MSTTSLSQSSGNSSPYTPASRALIGDLGLESPSLNTESTSLSTINASQFQSFSRRRATTEALEDTAAAPEEPEVEIIEPEEPGQEPEVTPTNLVSNVITTGVSLGEGTAPVLRRSSRKGKAAIEVPGTSTSPQVTTRRRSRLLSKEEGEEPSKKLKFDDSEDEQEQSMQRDQVGYYFATKKALAQSKVFANKGVHPEKSIHKGDFEKYGLLDLLASQSLLKSCSGFTGYSMKIVQEFYSNYLPGAQAVQIRGTQVPFTPSLINEFLGLPDIEEESPVPSPAELLEELTHGTVGEWHTTWKVICLNVKFLTSKYAALFRVGIANWFPSRHEGELDIEAAALLYRIVHGLHFNLGKWIFEKIQGFYAYKRFYFIFPALLTDYILSTSSVDLEEDEELKAIKGEIRIHYRLLQEPHFRDLFSREEPPAVQEEEESGHEEPAQEVQAQPDVSLTAEIPQASDTFRHEPAMEGESSSRPDVEEMIRIVDVRLQSVSWQLQQLKEDQEQLISLRNMLTQHRNR